jgi:hypothetical protein
MGIFLYCSWAIIVNQTGIYLTPISVAFVRKELDLSLIAYNFVTCFVGNQIAITNEKNDKCLSTLGFEAIDHTISHSRTECRLLKQRF